MSDDYLIIGSLILNKDIGSLCPDYLNFLVSFHLVKCSTVYEAQYN